VQPLAARPVPGGRSAASSSSLRAEVGCPPLLCAELGGLPVHMLMRSSACAVGYSRFGSTASRDHHEDRPARLSGRVGAGRRIEFARVVVMLSIQRVPSLTAVRSQSGARGSRRSRSQGWTPLAADGHSVRGDPTTRHPVERPRGTPGTPERFPVGRWLQVQRHNGSPTVPWGLAASLTESSCTRWT
jgi:hypothetical protein